MIQLQLYSTSHCHLCEEAENILEIIGKQHDISWTTIEITEDANLYEKYSLIIPVVKRKNYNTELVWPFAINDIEKLIDLK
ncbi:glutaredoxin family protein [Methylotenera sp.]|uniref:glutaredoxin family protein n=1 Tax=Methylotenera sp. TaxID=2051956 RepID=UPI00271CBBDE|nr:glutaredoxin family protein [Methylotenera sp.]MDO9394819.1 glutaredoxin family protein [Methylotenera sp.]MDP1522074.1 glutaredoxin family protein [Methylotenera sp.]MDP2070478.1 glutaredoxin family protein [Methylotenera sp.]MDP2229899.1 glutaredoxin family protein [Methylotenera sp.]MDP3006292.1 glutaredoxin family protein [Methylotenera sp.]